MLAQAVESYLKVRRACGFEFKCQGNLLQSFAVYSNRRGRQHICSDVAIEWAGLAEKVERRARRLGEVIRFARYIRAEDPSHELPPPAFGSEKRQRAIPYIFSPEDIQRLIKAASESGYRTLRRKTYSTLFALLACTGLRVSEAIRLRFDDITPDGLVVRCSKFRKSRLVPLHETVQAGIQCYLEDRLPYAPFDDHVFISLRRKPLLIQDVDTAFRTAVDRIGLQHLTVEEMQAIFDAPLPTTRYGIRDRAMLHLCFAGGLRVSELIGLRVNDLTLHPHASILIHGKGRRQRCLPLWKETTSTLRAWLTVRGNAAVPELFFNARGEPMTRSGFEYILHKHVRTAATSCPSLSAKRISPHVLRHTCALTVLQATKDLRKVSLWLGHANMQTTEIYTRTDPSIKLEALESVIPPKLRSGRFKATDELIASLQNGTIMRSKKIPT